MPVSKVPLLPNIVPLVVCTIKQNVLRMMDRCFIERVGHPHEPASILADATSPHNTQRTIGDSLSFLVYTHIIVLFFLITFLFPGSCTILTILSSTKLLR
jgi:hypothetical protein